MADSPVLYVYYRPDNDDAYPGVPNRHITEADWARFSPSQRRTVEEATTQDGYTRRKVWVHRDLVDETEQERADREAAEQAAREAYERGNSLVRYREVEGILDQMATMPSAAELTDLRADVDAVAEVPALVETITPEPGKEVIGGPSGPVQRSLVIDQKAVAGSPVNADSTMVKPAVNKIAPDVYTSTINGGGQQGYENVIGGDPSTVGGGTPNQTVLGTGAHVSTIAGGYDHVITALAGTIGGGGHNIIRGSHGTVAGGSYNDADGDYSTVGGGTANKATATKSVIVGGSDNIASGSMAVVVGGARNTASADRAVVYGGQDNIASSPDAAVLGGLRSEAVAQGAVAMGMEAKAYTPGMTAQAFGRFAATGDAQAGRFTLRAITTDGTMKVAGVTGSGGTSHNMQNKSAMMYRMQVIAREGSTNDTKGWTVQGVVSNADGANAVQVGGIAAPTVVAASAGAAAWTCAIATGADSFQLRVTGEAGKTINWVALVEFVEVVV